MESTRIIVNSLIAEDLERNSNFTDVSPHLGHQMRDVVQYALESGKRLRSLIVASMSRCKPGSGHGRDRGGGSFALYIEYVHNASLIVDDMPCMDNDGERRGRATVHTKYGEHIAQLTAYNLMVTATQHFSEGYYAVQKRYNAEDQDKLYHILHDEVSEGLGYRGICGGQLLDLLLCKDSGLQSLNPREGRELCLKMIRMKTGCLFSISCTLGWVSRYGSVDAIPEIKEAGYSLGLCYQIIDDLNDVHFDQDKNGGVTNICKYFSYNEIVQLFSDEMGRYSETMTKYQLWNPTLRELRKYMLDSFHEGLGSLQ